jgi:hypothetical protein
MENTRRRYANSVIGLMALCAAVIFWPSSDPSERYSSVTTYHVTQAEMVPAEKAHDEANSILAKARSLSAAGELTPDRIFALQKRMDWLERHAEQYGPNPRPGQGFYSTSARFELAAIRDSDPKFRALPSEEHKRYQNMFTSDPEYQAIKRFWASETVSNEGAVAMKFLRRYTMSIPIGIIVCIFLMFWQGFALREALGYSFAHPVLLAFYPFGMIHILLMSAGFANWDDCRRGIRRMMTWPTYAITAAVSMFCSGTAGAQTVKKEEKKKSAGYSLQIDTRFIDPVGDSPKTVFNRSTLNTDRWFAEAITTVMPKTGVWYNESGVGPKVIHRPKTTLVAMGIVSNDSQGVRKAIAGVQFFRSFPLCSVMVPAARVEKVNNGDVGFTFVTNPFCRLGLNGLRSRLAIVPDEQIRKTIGKPATWLSGVGLGFFVRKGKPDRAEVAMLRSSTGQWQVRSRFILNLAF